MEKNFYQTVLILYKNKNIQKEETYGRQCLFIVPDQKTINFKDLDKDIKNFRYVMD